MDSPMRLDFLFAGSMTVTIPSARGRKKNGPVREVPRAKSHAAGGDGKVSSRHCPTPRCRQPYAAACAMRTSPRNDPWVQQSIRSTHRSRELAIEARNRQRLAWIAAIVVVAAAAGAAYHYFEPIADWSGLLEEWVDASGALGMVVFGAIYVLATLLL